MRELNDTIMRRSLSIRNSFHKIKDTIIPQFGISNQGKLNIPNDDDDDIIDTEADNLQEDVLAPEGIRRRITLTDLRFPPDLTVQRQALTVAKKHEQYNYETPHQPGFRETVKTTLKKKTKCSRKKAKETLYLRLPILDWLFRYKIRRDLVNDIIAGFTVGILNIPQGMAYAMLAGLAPIVGIYMGFFPVLIYATFASSRHNSIGTFAVVCIMSGKVIEELSTTPVTVGLGFAGFVGASNGTTYEPTEVASILSFAVGVWMVVFGLLSLGTLSVFLSDMLVSGFTTGCAIHVLTSQIPKLFGIDSESYQGVFKIPKTWWSILQNIWYSNPTTMVISLICFFILIVNNEFIKPRLRKVTRIPIPIELIVVVGATLASKGCDLNEDFGVDIIGDIPTGMPPPKLPPFELYDDVLLSSLGITIVSYTVSFSMAKIFAKRLDYNVDATQELYALGLSNFMGCLFSCAPISASLSRSLIQQTVGGATQLASYISCALLVLCALAAIIAVALKGMFLQFGDVVDMWKISKPDACIWIIAFLGVVILDINYGLLLGIVAVLLLLIYRNQSPNMTLLGRVGETDVYLDKTRYCTVDEIPGIKICHISGSLHFANQEAFRNTLVKKTGLDPKAIMKWKKKQEKLLKKEMKAQEASHINPSLTVVGEEDEKRSNIGDAAEGGHDNGAIDIEIERTDIVEIEEEENKIENHVKEDIQKSGTAIFTIEAIKEKLNELQSRRRTL
ncbi:Prestin [Armadillidium nasatum]|uniref:Prestin n=1 Tax=Armadillidium nasatum TaxID=96803 RepID=A0A5N5SV58_9CRUS|nr:Prestin [Armadillidium nasatum]